MKINIVTDEMTSISLQDGLESIQVAPESQKRIDFNNSSDRKWMMNHITWSLNNNRAIVLIPESN